MNKSMVINIKLGVIVIVVVAMATAMIYIDATMDRPSTEYSAKTGCDCNCR